MTPPIGLFDSGLGGLSVARELLQRRPGDRLWVIGDTAHVPYGGRPLEQVRGFALGLTDHLERGGCRAVVMACNISSAVALDEARRRSSVPVFGMVDAGARAAAASSGSVFGVMTTEGTLRSGAYEAALRRLRPEARVASVACPRFVPLVESGRWEAEEAYSAALEYAAPLIARRVDTVILGCTHYPFLGAAIRAAFPYPVQLLDPAEAVARELDRTLGPAPEHATQRHRFEATADTAAFSEAGSVLLSLPFTASRCDVWDRRDSALSGAAGGAPALTHRA